ncbi:transcription factor IIA, alpha/beta subunit [Paraphysoderma sedebokerense]|nr:transcription factor IIA, alpha/beta subunit [Paraphysoderma sedebokerense]KAI9144172.1 transcription factor IIA, alpha/beta subunit [Paraphysoderma sedebokerense]
MSNTIVPAIYRSVIADVVENMKDDFLNVGVDESVLLELQQIWEAKIVQSRVADFRGEYAEEGENNDYYESADGYGYGADQYSQSNIPNPIQTAPNLTNLATLASVVQPHNNPYGHAPEMGRPQAYMPQRAQPGVGAGGSNVYSLPTLLPGGARLPQTDGAGDDDIIYSSRESNRTESSSEAAATFSTDPKTGETILEVTLPDHIHPLNQRSSSSSTSKISQVDGSQDEDGNETHDEDAINSDLDDSDEDDDENADSETTNMMLCQYEKVTRTKNKWKCVLKDGIININGVDYLFNKANGDFQF